MKPSIVLPSGEKSYVQQTTFENIVDRDRAAGCGLALIALAGQVVSAQSLEPELKPPSDLKSARLPWRRKLQGLAAQSS